MYVCVSVKNIQTPRRQERRKEKDEDRDRERGGEERRVKERPRGEGQRRLLLFTSHLLLPSDSLSFFVEWIVKKRRQKRMVERKVTFKVKSRGEAKKTESSHSYQLLGLGGPRKAPGTRQDLGDERCLASASVVTTHL